MSAGAFFGHLHHELPVRLEELGDRLSEVVDWLLAHGKEEPAAAVRQLGTLVRSAQKDAGAMRELLQATEWWASLEYTEASFDEAWRKYRGRA